MPIHFAHAAQSCTYSFACVSSREEIHTSNRAPSQLAFLTESYASVNDAPTCRDFSISFKGASSRIHRLWYGRKYFPPPGHALVARDGSSRFPTLPSSGSSVVSWSCGPFSLITSSALAPSLRLLPGLARPSSLRLIAARGPLCAPRLRRGSARV